MKKFTKFLIAGFSALSITLSGCVYEPPGSEEDPVTPVTKKDFQNLIFEDKEFTFDGLGHSIYVENVPEGANVNYVNNNKVQVGTYTVTATVSKDDYNTQVLSANLIIKAEPKKDFEGIKLESNTFDYDGQNHSLILSGAPEDALIAFTNNSQKDVGTYTVTATISKVGYNTLVLTATLTINGIDFTGLTFNSQTFDYDGKYHSLEVSGAPQGATITYTNNSKKNVGTYTVTAIISMNGYNTKELTATLTINPLDFGELIFESKTFEYDGKSHSLAVENLPSGATATYKGNGKTAVGVYTVTATVSKTGYNNKVLTATLEITPAKDPIEVDPNKTAFPLNSSTTFDDFKEAIFSGNFTVDFISGSRYFDYLGENDNNDYYKTTNDISTKKIYAADKDKAYEKIDELWSDPETTEIIYTKVVEDYAFSKHIFSDDGFERIDKIPAFAFDETYLKHLPAEIFNHLKRTDDNGFETFLYVDYYDYYADFEFSNNKFTIDVHTHIDHADIKRVIEEYYTLTFYNIGNTIVNIPAQHVGSVNDAENYNNADFIYNGISYSNFEDESSANITLSYGEIAYLPKGHLQLLPDVFGVPIKTITMDFYTAKWGDHAADYTDYILDTEFSRTEDVYGNIVFKYGLKYKTYGYLNSKDIYNWGPKYYFDRFTSFGGEINYHGVDVDDVGFFQDRTNGSLEDLDKYNISVINADYYTDKQIQEIQATGTKVFAYLNIGLISKSASYYEDFKDVMLKDYELDSNYSWIDVSYYFWETYVKDTLIKGLCNRGVDGIYLDGTRVYELYETGRYDARQSIGDMILRVDYYDMEVMVQSCDSMMWDFTYDGTNRYAPYYVDYYVQEEVFTKVINADKNEFGVQDSEIETALKTEIINANNEFKFNVVLLEHEVDKNTNDKIKSYCEEMGYHCYLS